MRQRQVRGVATHVNKDLGQSIAEHKQSGSVRRSRAQNRDCYSLSLLSPLAFVLCVLEHELHPFSPPLTSVTLPLIVLRFGFFVVLFVDAP